MLACVGEYRSSPLPEAAPLPFPMLSSIALCVPHLQHGHVLAGLDGLGCKQNELLCKQHGLQLTGQRLHRNWPGGICSQHSQVNDATILANLRCNDAALLKHISDVFLAIDRGG